MKDAINKYNNNWLIIKLNKQILLNLVNFYHFTIPIPELKDGWYDLHSGNNF